ncbi:MAG TPA: hypothetical protein PLO51_00105 [Candidatus Micrarchaeota archaeon]|nr:hypothetical protein [Candidatus Micrarchaeota archaeon]
MNSRKGQAALDFLMTYGWAIALVVIIAAVLFALGVFDVSNFVGNKASGFSGVAVAGWQMSSAGVLTMKLSNQVGQQIRIDSVNVTVGQSSGAASPAVTLSTGATTDYITVNMVNATGLTPGAGYTAKVTIGYTDLNANFPYVTSGTLTGKVV